MSHCNSINFPLLGVRTLEIGIYKLQVQLRPHAYYELTDGCELTFADIKCQYFLGPPPDMKEDGDEETYEQTQAYNLADGEESAIGGGGRSTTAGLWHGTYRVRVSYTYL